MQETSRILFGGFGSHGDCPRSWTMVLTDDVVLLLYEIQDRRCRQGQYLKAKNREQRPRENMRGDTRKVTRQRRCGVVMSCRVEYSGTTIQGQTGTMGACACSNMLKCPSQSTQPQTRSEPEVIALQPTPQPTLNRWLSADSPLRMYGMRDNRRK